MVTSVAADGIRIRTPWESGVVPRGRDESTAVAFRAGDVVWVNRGARGTDGATEFTFDSQPQIEGALVAIDPQSSPYIKGSQIDFVETLQGSGFAIQNPNAVRSCGCGNSFETEEAGQAGAEESAT